MNIGRTLLLTGMTLVAVLARFLPHPPNFAPIDGLALFAGAAFADRRLAFLVPFLALFLGDLALGLHATIPFVYGAFALTVGLGLLLRGRQSVLNVGTAALASSVLFFLISNFGFWFVQWPDRSWAGLLTCYADGVPFFHWTVLGDLAYTAVLFGGLAVAEALVPALRPEEQPI